MVSRVNNITIVFWLPLLLWLPGLSLLIACCDYVNMWEAFCSADVSYLLL